MRVINLLSAICLVFLFSCQNNEAVKSNISSNELSENEDTLYRFCEGEYELGTPAGFKNSKGKVIIPVGKYSQIWTDKFVDFAIVSDKKNTGNKTVAINQKGEELFEVYWFDNGPDYVSEGLFRVKQNDKIGFANEKGEIVIPCQYACADPFENGKAKVAMKCEMIKEGEYTVCKSDNWTYIDKKGKGLD